MSRTLRSLWVFVVLCLLILPGCGKGGAIIKGTLVLPSKVKLKENDTVRISFVPEDQKSQVYPATYSATDHSFVVQGPGKKGIPAGKYKVGVQFTPYPGSEESDKRSAVLERINDDYNVARSNLTYEVTAEPTQSITIDLSIGTLRKN